MNNHIPVSQPSECDDYRGFYPLNSITIDKILVSTNDLEKVISDLINLLDNNPDSITLDQSEKVFSETIGTIEMSLNSIFNYFKIQKSPQLKSITTNMPKDEALFSFFYDYTQLAIKVYNQKIFYNPSFYPFIIFFTNLCCYYIEIFQNPNSTNLKKDFKNAWNENYIITMRLQHFYREVGLAREFNKIDQCFDIAELTKLNKLTEHNHIIYDIAQSLNVLSKDVKAYEKEENSTLAIQNMIIDLKSLRSNFSDLRNFLKESDQKIFTEKLNTINSLLATLESCVTFYNLTEMANKLNIFIQNEVFSLPSDIVQNDYNNWICFKLSLQALQLNLKMLVSTQHSLNQIDQKSIECYRTIKKILTSIDNSIDDPKNVEIVTQFINDMKLVRPLNESLMYKNFVIFYDEQIDFMSKNFDEKYKDLSTQAKNYYEKFKSCSKLCEEKGNLKTATNRFSFFSNFEDVYRSLQRNPQAEMLKIDENLFKIKYYINMNVVYFSNQFLLQHIQNIFGRLTGNPELYNTIERQRNLKSIWTTMLNLVNSIYSDNDEPKEWFVFFCFFRLFLKVCITVLELNEKSKANKYGKVIEFILILFPRNEQIKKGFLLQSQIDTLRALISHIQSQTIKVNEVVYMQNEAKEPTLSSSNGGGSKENTDTTLVKFFECEGGMTEISMCLKKLETIRQTTQFFLIYENFMTKYELNPAPVISSKGQVLNPLLFEYFPHFTKEMIFMLKSPYLNVNIMPSFIEKWLSFIRSLILNDFFDRKESFSLMINEIPFIDFSKLIRISFLNFMKIDSLVRKTIYIQKQNCMNESTIAMQLIEEREKKYNEESSNLKKFITNLIVPIKFENPNFETNGNNLISTILQINSDLYSQVQKYWLKMILIFRFFEKFNWFIKVTQEIRDDFKIEKKEFPKREYQHFNVIMCIESSLKEINKANYIPNELSIVISELSRKVNEVRQIFKYLFCDDLKQLDEKVYISLILKMQDLEKVLLQTNPIQFANSIRSILALKLPIIATASSDASYTRCEDAVNEILQLVDAFEKDIDDNNSSVKFAILYDIKQKVKQFKQTQEPIFIEFYKQLKNSINCEMNLLLVKCLIGVHICLILQIMSDNHEIIENLAANSTSLHQIDSLPSICQIPEILQKFDFVINKYCSKKKSKNDKNDEDDEDEGEDFEKDEILNNLASALLNVKMNASFKMNEIITSLKLKPSDIQNHKSKSEKFRRLQTVYAEKLQAFEKARNETRIIKEGMNNQLNQIQHEIAEVNMVGLKLKYEYKKLVEIEKTQIEKFNKPAAEMLEWAKLFLSSMNQKASEKRKVTSSSTLNPVLPVINSEIKETIIPYNLPKNAKVTNSMIVEIEQRFQKTFEKNKFLWEKAKSFSKSGKDDENELKKSEENTKKSDIKNGFNDGELFVKNDEILNDFNSTIETVYELFNRSSFLMQVLFSNENSEQDGFSFSNSAFSGSANSSSNSSGYSSANSSGTISYQNTSFSSSGNYSTAYAGGGGAAYDEEEIIEMLDAFNNELFDRALKFFFINKILQRKSEKKSRRRIKVKKQKKSVLREILEDEVKNQQE